MERVVAQQENEAATATFSPRINPQSKRPKINPKSKALSAKHHRTSVFERLEKHAEDRMFKLMQAEIAAVDAGIRDSRRVKAGRDDALNKQLLKQFPDVTCLMPFQKLMNLN
ncbi:unnamed protein product [Aphanomyces euteiches]